MRRRVLHVVGRMHRAGVETWLMQLVRKSEALALQHDFLVHAAAEAAYDQELLDRGCRIYRVRGSRRSLRYSRHLDSALANALADGPLDAIHAHEQLWCGPILEAARRAGIPVRIAHSHNDTVRLERFPNLARIGFGAWMRRRIRSSMTHGLSCSELAAASLFGDRWQEDPRVRIHYYGLDFERFLLTAESARVRHSLGIPSGSKVLGHIGRCEPQKNQRKLLEVFREACRLHSGLHLLLIGEGAMESSIRSYIGATGLSSRVTWLRNRADIPALMVSAMDVFLLPSLHEGLPLVLLEAQAAGLPCLFSSEITAEADLFPESNRRLSHRRPCAEWVCALEHLLQVPRPDRALRIKLLSSGPFSAQASLCNLAALYRCSPIEAAPLLHPQEVCR